MWNVRTKIKWGEYNTENGIWRTCDGMWSTDSRKWSVVKEGEWARGCGGRSTE